MSLFSGVWKQLHNKTYRKTYMKSYASMHVPFQIRALRRAREWTRDDLAERTGLSRQRIADLEEAGAAPRTLNTLYKIAAAFDVGLLVEFVPFSKLLSREETFKPTSFNVPSFQEDTFPPPTSILSMSTIRYRPPLTNVFPWTLGTWKALGTRSPSVVMIELPDPSQEPSEGAKEKVKTAVDVSALWTAHQEEYHVSR